MKEWDVINDFAPDDYDPVLDEQFHSLGHLSPSPSFEDRVMARVHVPEPAWLQRVETGGRRLVKSTGLRWWTRSLATVSVMSLTIIVAFVVTNAAEVTAFVTARFGGAVVAAWRAGLGLASAMAVETYAFLGAGAVPGVVLLVLALLVAATFLFNTWALYRLMQPPTSRAIRTS